jgi:hypothetical protein
MPIKINPLVMEPKVLQGEGVDFWDEPDRNNAVSTDIDELKKNDAVDTMLRNYALSQAEAKGDQS